MFVEGYIVARIEGFETHSAQYEQWFENHEFAYESELAAVRQLVPSAGRGIEIGVGSGRFAAPLGIEAGIEPSEAMRVRAQERGIDVRDAVAEHIPFPDESFDYALMVTTVCFVDDVATSFREVQRVLRPGGAFIVGFVDLASPLGKTYLQHKNENPFYRDATFYTTDQIMTFLRDTGFSVARVVQTVFGPLSSVDSVQQPKEGYGQGGFVVIRAENTGNLK